MRLSKEDDLIVSNSFWASAVTDNLYRSPDSLSFFFFFISLKRVADASFSLPLPGSVCLFLCAIPLTRLPLSPLLLFRSFALSPLHRCSASGARCRWAMDVSERAREFLCSSSSPSCSGRKRFVAVVAIASVESIILSYCYQ